MEEQVICPWCASEIIWDAEIGPETHCPHCENELGNYRSVNVSGDQDSAEADDQNWQDEEEESYSEDEVDQDSSSDEGLRRTSHLHIAAESAISQLIEEQDEVPECPACRSYMLETGTQTIGGVDFESKIVRMTGQSVLPEPFAIKWYVCPSCFQTSSVLSDEARIAMLKRFSDEE